MVAEIYECAMINWLKQWWQGEDREFGVARSPLWNYFRNKHIEQNPLCAVCDTKEDCAVHHIIPFTVNPHLELKPENFLTLCREHHLWIGHLGSFRSYNIDVIEDAKIMNTKIKNRP